MSFRDIGIKIQAAREEKGLARNNWPAWWAVLNRPFPIMKKESAAFTYHNWRK